MQNGSIILPTYETGTYFKTHADPDQDSPFKAAAFERVWHGLVNQLRTAVASYADVGCGGGATTALVSAALKRNGSSLERVAGYDISPHVLKLNQSGVDFYFEDFCRADASFDLVTLFDVVEHVPDPVSFLRAVAERSNYVALHIPLDHSLVNCFFDRFRKRIRYPGHLIVLDTPGALNMVANAGLCTLDYAYTHGYSAPSGTMSVLQSLAYPFRATLAKISPWLASRTVGGVSLMLIAATPKGLGNRDR